MTTSYAKIEITGTLTVLTGLQIGAGDGFSAIGAVDKPVVRDPLSRLPMIPGTSLKGGQGPHLAVPPIRRRHRNVLQEAE